jgi:bifunctional DNase/RNase
MARRRARQRAKQQNQSLIIAALAALLVISLGYIAYLSLQPAGTPLSIGEVRQAPGGEAYFVAPQGFVEQDVFRVEGLQTIVIGKGCTALVADTSPERAEAIRDGLAGRVTARPNAYDQWADMLSSFGIGLEAVTLHDFDGDVYLSTGVFRQGSSVLEQDMRPSDALALAVRAGAKVYLKQALLDAYGENIC